MNKMNPIKRTLACVVKERQKKGIRDTRYVLNYEMGITQDALKKMGSAPINLAIPAVYNREKLPLHPTDSVITRALERANKSDFTILHHSRLKRLVTSSMNTGKLKTEF